MWTFLTGRKHREKAEAEAKAERDRKEALRKKMAEANGRHSLLVAEIADDVASDPLLAHIVATSASASDSLKPSPVTSSDCDSKHGRTSAADSYMHSGPSRCHESPGNPHHSSPPQESSRHSHYSSPSEESSGYSNHSTPSYGSDSSNDSGGGGSSGSSD